MKYSCGLEDDKLEFWCSSTSSISVNDVVLAQKPTILLHVQVHYVIVVCVVPASFPLPPLGTFSTI